jgi:hypothetical protein
MMGLKGEGTSAVTNHAREAAALLHALLSLLDDRGGRDTGLRHRIEGAAVALNAVSECEAEPPAP